MQVIVRELEEVKLKHGEKRRTEIIDNEAEIQIEDLIQEEDMVVTISHSGYIKRTPVSMYQAQKRGGKGNKGHGGPRRRFPDPAVHRLDAQLRVLLLQPRQSVREEGVRDPQAARNAKGRAIINFIEMEAEEKIAAITPVDKVEAGKFVTTITRGGQIKKTELVEYENFRDKGIIGVRIADDDQLFTAIVTDGTAEFFVATKTGISIRFDEEQVRAHGPRHGRRQGDRFGGG